MTACLKRHGRSLSGICDDLLFFFTPSRSQLAFFGWTVFCILTSTPRTVLKDISACIAWHFNPNCVASSSRHYVVWALIIITTIVCIWSCGCTVTWIWTWTWEFTRPSIVQTLCKRIHHPRDHEQHLDNKSAPTLERFHPSQRRIFHGLLYWFQHRLWLNWKYRDVSVSVSILSCISLSIYPFLSLLSLLVAWHWPADSSIQGSQVKITLQVSKDHK